MSDSLLRTVVAIFVISVVLQIQPTQCTNKTIHVYALSFLNTTTDGVDKGFVQVFASSFENQYVRIRIPHVNTSDVTSLDASNNRQFNFSRAIDLASPMGEAVVAKGVIIISEGEISVQAVKTNQGAGDAFLSLPLNKHGHRQFVLPSYTSAAGGMGHAEFSVAAAVDGACVEAWDFSGTKPVRVLTASLNMHEIKQVYSATEDYTGLFVNSTVPIAVFAGHECAQVPETKMFCDHLVEQVPPLEMLGVVAVTAPILGRAAGVPYIVRVVGAHDNTQVTIPHSPSGVRVRMPSLTNVCSCHAGMTSTDTNCAPCPLTIKLGTFVEYMVLDATQAATFVCSKPCLTAQYNVGTAYLSITAERYRPDPFMVVVPPVERYVKRVSFATPDLHSGSGNYQQHVNFVSAVTMDGSQGAVLFDGAAISATWSTIGPYAYTSFPITHGFHNMTSSANFMAYAYGHGPQNGETTSYSFPTGYLTTLPGDQPYAPPQDHVPWEQHIAAPPATLPPASCSYTHTAAVPAGDVTVTMNLSVMETAPCIPVVLAAMATRAVALRMEINDLLCNDVICRGHSKDIFISSIQVNRTATTAIDVIISVTTSTPNTVTRDLLLCKRAVDAYIRHVPHWQSSTNGCGSTSTTWSTQPSAHAWSCFQPTSG